jgi:hypothetical protein
MVGALESRAASELPRCGGRAPIRGKYTVHGLFSACEEKMEVSIVQRREGIQGVSFCGLERDGSTELNSKSKGLGGIDTTETGLSVQHGGISVQ